MIEVILGLKIAGQLLAAPPVGTIQIPTRLGLPHLVPALVSLAGQKETNRVTVVSESKASVKEPLCTLTFFEESPAKILAALGKQAKTNIIFLTTSDKKVTLRLKDTPLSEVIRHLAALTEMSFLKVRGTYLIGPGATLKANYPKEWEAAQPKLPALIEPNPGPNPAAETALLGNRKSDWVIEVFPLDYMTPDSVATMMASVFDKEDLEVISGPTSMLPVITTSGNAVGVSGGSSPNSNGERKSRAVILKGSPSAVAQAIALIKKLDIAGRQVNIEVSIFDVSDNALKELGVTWSFGNLAISESGNKNFAPGSFSRSDLGIANVLKALESTDKAKMLATPNITVQDGESGYVLIGQKYTFPKIVGTNINGSPLYDTTEQEVGIVLNVAAKIASNGEITLNLYPQVSTILGFTEVAGTSYPQLATRESQTTLMVRSGETIVMGGLIKTDDFNQVEKVPGFGDIPILGEFFKRRKRTQNRSQIVITLKPTIINGNKS